jgi:tetratricopeptide (TPR) repeat protein
MQSVLEQCTRALQQRDFATVRDVACAALAGTEAPPSRQPLLELLAQAQAGLQDHAAAAQTWQQAYDQSALPPDKLRLFERARQAYQHLQDYAALLRLAQAQLPHARSPQERAACLLVAGEALMRLQQHQVARHQYLEPAVDLVGVAPETRAFLWHALARCYLAGQAFATAQEAFRRVAGLTRGLDLAPRLIRHSPPHAQLHHLRNTAHFYDGVLHLLSHRTQQAVPALQALQPPLTDIGALNAALFLALAYRRLHQPDAAARAVQTLTRSAALPDMLRGPHAVVCAGIANLRQATAEVGAHLEAALDASLVPRTFWEPLWRALLYQELGLTLWHIGDRQAAIACYEDGLKAVLHQAGIWHDAPLSDWLRGPSLLLALENLPLHTWPAAIQGELLRLLQGLAWLYGSVQDGALVEAALALALRLATTPETQASLWLHRGWHAATRPGQQDMGPASCSMAEMLLEVQRARAHGANAPLAHALQGVEALLQGDAAMARACFAQMSTVPAAPEVQALCLAMWCWAHAQQGTLACALRRARVTPWQTETMLMMVLELLLAWTTGMAAPAPEAVVAWLAPLLAQQGQHTLPALHRLCRPGVLPKAQHTALRAALTSLLADPAYAACADQVAELLGGEVLLERLDVLLARLDQRGTLMSAPFPHVSRRQQRRHHQTSARHQRRPETTPVLRLIGRLEKTRDATVEPTLPAVIQHWLVHYPHLGTQAPDVVGALLSLLRQCPTAHATIQDILAHVALSRRQWQALEAALQTPPPAAVPARDPLAWEPIRSWPLARLLETLADFRQQPSAPLAEAAAARAWYILATVFARVGLLPRAVACLDTCLRLHPEQPLAHFMLAQLLCIQHQYGTAWRHIQQAWQGLLAQVPQPQVLHLEVLNQALVLLGATQQYTPIPAWLATFERCRVALQATARSAAQRQRLHEEEAAYAMAQALYLGSAPSSPQTPDVLEQQLTLFARAIAQGTPSTQYVALHRQAETLAHLQRLDDAAATYTRVVQQWPEDRRARRALALLTAMRQATIDVAAADQALAEALSLAFASPSGTPEPLTPQTALNWLRQASPRHPGYTDVTDVLTVYGGLSIQRGELTQALEVLSSVYALVAQPGQAYYLAEAYYARSQRADSVTDQLQDCERALQYAQHALASVPHQQRTRARLQELQALQQRLSAVRQRDVAMQDYRTRVCRLFARAGVAVQQEVVDQAPEAPWLTLHELADLDEASGTPVVTVRLCFNANASGTKARPSMSDIALYVQHQGDVQRLVAALGMAAVSWPPIAYAGNTAFESIFPERVALNRDLVFLVYAEHKALLRYAQVLQQTAPTLPTLAAAAPPPSVSRLIAAARQVTIMPLLHQRLRMLGMSAASKALLQQIETLWAEVLSPSLLEQLQTCPAFADATAYFGAIAEALRPRLEALPAARPRRSEEADVPPRPERRRQRRTPIPRHDDWAPQAPSAASQARSSSNVRKKARMTRVGVEVHERMM